MENPNQYEEAKTPIDGMHSYCQHYRGNSVGRVIHYITVICGLTIGERVQVDNGKATYPTSNHPFATYTLDKGYPDLTFKDAQWNTKKDKLLEQERVSIAEWQDDTFDWIEHYKKEADRICEAIKASEQEWEEKYRGEIEQEKRNAQGRNNMYKYTIALLKRLYNIIFTVPNEAYESLPHCNRFIIFMAIVVPLAVFVPANIQIPIGLLLITYRHQAFITWYRRGMARDEARRIHN